MRNKEISKLEKSADFYAKVAEIIKYTSEEIFKIPVPQNTLVAWEKTMRAIKYVDHEIDNNQNPKKRSLFTANLLAYIQHDIDSLETENQKLKNSVQELRSALKKIGHDNLDEFYKNLTLLSQITEKIKFIRDQKEFIEIEQIEAEKTAMLLISLMPDNSKKYNKWGDFVKMVNSIARIGNSLDAVIDLKKDYNNQEICINPTIKNRIAILKSSFKDLEIILKSSDLGLLKYLISHLFLTFKN